MGDIFASSEIVEIGIQIEKNGRDFYNILVKQSKNPQASQVFKYLSGEEEKHIVIFQEILGWIAQHEPKESYPEEYFAYMNALASEHVFTQKDAGTQIAKNIKSDKEAVDLGIGFEKDSIIFYEGVKKVVPEYDQKVVDALIAQEQSHLTQLVDLKKTL